MGFFSRRLEKYFSEYLGVNHIILTGMGRTGITVGLRAFGISPGDEVIIPAFICPAVEDAVMASGARVVYADVDIGSFNLTLDNVKEVISNKTRVIIVNHTFGVPANIDEFRIFCDEKGLFLIEDCVSSYGANYDGRKVGTFGDIAIFSVYKILLNTGGGFVAIRDNALASSYYMELKKLIDETGKSKKSQKFYSSVHNLLSSFQEVYGVTFPFYNYAVKYLKNFHRKQKLTGKGGWDKRIMMTNIECFLAFLQLPLLKMQINRRVAIGNIFSQRLGRFKSVNLYPERDKVVCRLKCVPVYVKDGARPDLMKSASKAGLKVVAPWSSLNSSSNANTIADNVAIFPFRLYFFEKKIDRLKKILMEFEQKN
ncbi:MAG: DegT/DnrJ/EryC1/StrS aminotransferase family protein [Flavobacteriaceae bacterium]|nr:DegT/DnrJ/EryC1/StrS aminotransferase family protein [Flavobacteriaceae bacterium]